MINLKYKIKELISSKKEGDYWDFKRQKHHDPLDLVHDIICLANQPHHKGDRYLIFGVDNTTYDILGITEKHEQHKIIDTLRNAKFANDTFPDIYLEELKIDEKQIEVIIIKDHPSNRPYFLSQDKRRKTKQNSQKATDNQSGDEETNTLCAGAIYSRLRVGTIYSRVRDSNTPKNGVASTADIEKMWRQRFGLDLTPLERMTQYLLDFEGWVAPLENTEWNHLERPSELLSEKGFMYYTKAPEFTIKKSPLYGDDDSDLGDKVEGGESWVRKARDPNSRMYKLELMYHQTVLHTEAALTYDVCDLFNNPKKYSELKKFEGMEFYYYLESDILSFNILQFLHKTPLDYTSKIVSPRRADITPLIIFKDENELEAFCKYLDEIFNISSINDIKFYQDRAHDWEKHPQDVINIQLCLFVQQKLPDWRNAHAN